MSLRGQFYTQLIFKGQYTRILFFFRNMVHHFWCYKGLADREAVRAQAWEHADRSKHVRNTVSNFNIEKLGKSQKDSVFVKASALW